MDNCDFRLIVGLGNPGLKYLGNRHNIGFQAIQKIALKYSVDFKESKKLKGDIGEIRKENKIVRLLMPKTFMNESGQSVINTINWFGLNHSQILILFDDMDLPLGHIRVKSKGRSGGHNGLKSIIKYLGTNEFYRIKIGIGHPSLNQEERKAKTISHVLGNFSINEQKIVGDVLDEIINGLILIEEEGIKIGTTRLNSYKNNE